MFIFEGIFDRIPAIFPALCAVSRHQKKVLALVLAFACAFTMFAGAAFTDEADIVNAEAVDLLTELNIINGYSDGSFKPEGDVTRAEFAKMIYVIRNGGNDDASAHANNPTSFTDLTDSWYQGYIKYLQNTGIVAGKTATQFDPDGNVTTGEALKMALVLGGYRADKAGLTGTKWLTNTVTLATTNRLLNDVNSSITGACTRQDAAQILANALDMTAVRYSEIVEDFVNDSEDGLALGGDSISVGRKWMDLWTNVGTLTSIDGNDLKIIMSDSDKTDSDAPYIDEFTKVGTDYSNLLGQKVKVLFKDGKNNSVLGVYPIDDNNVVTVYQNEISVDAGKIVIDDESYSVETDGVTVIKDGEELNERWKAGVFKDQQSADVITLIDTDDNNKIDTAYIKTVEVAKVTYAASSQIIAGSKTYKFSEDTIDEDVEKDDWVIITKNLYNDNNDIVVAAKATGTVEATKDKTGWKQYQIGDEWFNESDSSNKDINTNVKPGVEAEYVAVNGILFYAAKTSAGSDKLTDVLFVAFVGKDGLSNDQARVMFPNGDKATINLKNSYSTQQDGTKGSQIADGTFYEYSKSGNTYELIDLSTDTDFYGDFTYRSTSTLAASGDMSYTISGTPTTKAIADSADVIVWTKDRTTVDFKHITGKQLKALIDTGAGPKVALGSSTGELDTALLGGFTSDVDGLNRASVLAVEYHSADGKLGAAFDNISSNANYGFITKDAVKVSNGMIKFTVWTGSENVEVEAEKSSISGFTKGTIVGYTAINDEDGTNVMTDAVAISLGDGVKAGSITSVNSKRDTIENTISGAEEDLDEYGTVLYVDSKAGTGIEDGEAAKANSQKANGKTYYATNLLVYGTEVAVIDINEIAGKRYGANTLDDTITGLSDIQWLNTRTQDTDEGAAYDGAIMELSFYADKAGTLKLENMSSVESKYNSGDDVVLPVKAGYNSFDSLIVTGANTGDVTGTFTVDGSTVVNPSNTTVTIDALKGATGLVYGTAASLDLEFTVENAGGKTPVVTVTDAADASATGVTVTGLNRITSDGKTYPTANIALTNSVAAGTYTVTLKVGDAPEETTTFTVAKLTINALGTPSGLPTSSDNVATVNGAYTVSGLTSGLTATVTVAETTDNGGTPGTIEATDIATATLTITASDANHVLGTAPAAPSGGWVAGTHTATSWVYTLDITVTA